MATQPITPSPVVKKNSLARHSIILDDIPDHVIRTKTKILALSLKKYVFFVSFIEFCLFVASVLFSALWWNDGYVWTMMVRSIVQVKFLFLWVALCMEMPVINMIGTGYFFKIPKWLVPSPGMALWAWVGMFEVAIVRISLLLVDIIYFCTFGPILSIQTLAFLIMGLVLVMEYYLSIYFIYYVAIRRHTRYAFFKPRINPNSVNLVKPRAKSKIAQELFFNLESGYPKGIDSSSNV